MKVFISLTVCCFVLSADSQSSFRTQNQYPKYDSTINSDQIYFDDNRPSGSINIQKELSNLNGLTIGTKIPIINPNFGAPQYSPYANNVIIQPSIQTYNQETTKIVPQKSGTPAKKMTDTFFQAQATRPEIDSIDYAITHFGINIFKQITSSQPGNMVVSPFSITTLLALLQQGATGSTLDQISAALHLAPLKTSEVFRNVMENVQKRQSQNILKTLNNIFVAETFNLNRDFERTAKSDFGSDVTLMNFGRPDVAIQRINNWVGAMTNGKIENLLSQDAISQSSQLVLVNVVYFKGLWQIPFRTESTVPQPFLLKGGIEKTARFMRTRRYFRTGLDPITNAKVISLPFEKDQYSLLVVLPHEQSDIDTLISRLTVEQLIAYQNFTAMDVELELPKFTVKGDTDLVPVFNRMGISNMFSNRAELFGLGTFREFSPQVSSAVHSAVLSIDEKGGSAAAATSFGVVALSFDDPAVVFKANRPFLAVLWDTALSLPLFMAKIEDPTE